VALHGQPHGELLTLLVAVMLLIGMQQFTVTPFLVVFSKVIGFRVSILFLFRREIAVTTESKRIEIMAFLGFETLVIEVRKISDPKNPFFIK
jgi:hypothetical protein